MRNIDFSFFFDLAHDVQAFGDGGHFWCAMEEQGNVLNKGTVISVDWSEVEVVENMVEFTFKFWLQKKTPSILRPKHLSRPRCHIHFVQEEGTGSGASVGNFSDETI